jgi:mRNA degradation ribonuclease J1/J2
VPLYRLYNDGNNGTGNKDELVLEERMSLAVEGIVIASIEVIRPPQTLVRPSGGGAEDGEVRPQVRSAESPTSRPMSRALCSTTHPTHALVAAQVGLHGVVRITTRGMWTDEGRMLAEIQKVSEQALFSLRRNSTIVYIERAIANEIRKVRGTHPLGKVLRASPFRCRPWLGDAVI